MNAYILVMGLLTIGVDGGGFFAQDASLRRAVLPAAELSLAIDGPFYSEASVGSGLGVHTEKFRGLLSRTTYLRFPLRIGANFEGNLFGLAANTGPALLGVATSLDDGGIRIRQMGWSLGWLMGFRAGATVKELDGGGQFKARMLLDFYLRGKRRDILLMGGFSWSL